MQKTSPYSFYLGLICCCGLNSADLLVLASSELIGIGALFCFECGGYGCAREPVAWKRHPCHALEAALWRGLMEGQPCLLLCFAHGIIILKYFSVSIKYDYLLVNVYCINFVSCLVHGLYTKANAVFSWSTSMLKWCQNLRCCVFYF